MERYYYKRDQKIAVEELPDVRAVHLSVDERGVSAAAEADLGASAMDAVRSTVGADTPDDALTAFENANWRFVRPSETLMRSLTASEAVPGAEAVGKVLRRSDGSVAIATNRLNVQLKPELSEHECKTILSEKDLHVRMKLAFAPNLYEVDANGREDALQASVELHDDPRFTFAEPSLTEHIPQRFSPTDPDYMNQWQWRNTGQSGGTAGADVHAEAAWDVTRGAGVRVAVIDNGFDADHEDLAPGVSAMSGFYTAAGGFVQGTAGMPDNNHGTFCAGMVGARQNNGHGGCGAAPQSELMLIAALGDQVGTQTTLARAVAYAGNPQTEVPGSSPGDGADILVSLGPNGADWDLTTTLDLAIEEVAANGRSGRGLAIFWAASNGANVDVTLDEVVSHPDVIAVVRSNRNDREDNAARGSSVELIAPGVDVYSTRSGDTYGTSTGTSFAAPCAAGCAALALSVNLNLTRDQLREVMRRSADKIGGVTYDANGHNDDYGFGRVNALEAVRQARHPRLVVGDFGYNAGGWRVNRHSRFLADLTGNGRADIVGFGNAGVWVSRNNGDGTSRDRNWSSAPSATTPGAGGWTDTLFPRRRHRRRPSGLVNSQRRSLGLAQQRRRLLPGSAIGRRHLRLRRRGLARGQAPAVPRRRHRRWPGGIVGSVTPGCGGRARTATAPSRRRNWWSAPSATTPGAGGWTGTRGTSPTSPAMAERTSSASVTPGCGCRATTATAPSRRRSWWSAPSGTTPGLAGRQAPALRLRYHRGRPR